MGIYGLVIFSVGPSDFNGPMGPKVRTQLFALLIATNLGFTTFWCFLLSFQAGLL